VCGGKAFMQVCVLVIQFPGLLEVVDRQLVFSAAKRLPTELAKIREIRL
jgi:hypothetical protein